MSELFGGASDYSSSGIDSLAQAQDDYNTFGPNTDDSSAERAIQNVLADVGTRSNIRNAVDYNPIFAQALNMSRGLQPGNTIAGNYPTMGDFQNKGIMDLARPSYLQPQVPGQKGMYFSPAERGLQETLPEMIRNYQENFSIGGILEKLINKGEDVYEKGKGFLEKTFEPEKKSDVGIMQNMNRAEANDIQRALMAGYDTNPYSRPDLATQTAGLNLDDIQKFISNPGVVGKALDYAQPFIQNIVPDNVKVDTGLIYDPQKPDDSYTGIKFTIPFN
jgi:hypothetical protein